ncbi:mannose-1-phosphate guanylyltransferase/mannose-6-phosphate isomerase [Thioalkalivibrio paradoxus]|uniref:mannose-1-phosphate guanylyltransferase n=1 Tax=Thioalkalivibrio paradoxus ARh 1 TaxID=713585 RepID=W0DEB8_9GAMM|nr:mannose-1-phosphate guanylyltransferase/mannose-6-phosphate isomerase [Thioalkalivibrio paradoxus]AHE96989.1 phosphomannose isomerase [Thioalkalivibrio paradoxus ARh 1]
MIHAVILAGGSGTRLWPLSRRQLPKQFLRLEGDRSLLEATLDRLQPLVEPANALVVTGCEHARGEAYQALRPFRTLLEPVGRNTAPAIALAAAWLSRKGDDPVMVVLPADHVIRDLPAFHAALRQAIAAAEQGALITFGIRPTHPETGYGYIRAVTDGRTDAPVERFTEKPDVATAEAFLADGHYWWNSGMFVWRASTILDEIQRHLPDLYEVLERIRAEWRREPERDDPQPAIEALFHEMPSISIDYGVLERSENVRLVPCDIGWSDVGSWDAVHDLAEHDTRGNAAQGNVLAIDCDNTLIHAGKRLVAAAGVRDLCVVETADAVLVVPRGETQRVRDLVDELNRRDAAESRLHLTVQRPWGSYTVLEESPAYKMKRITVAPGASLSLQRHQHRSEHWIVVSGTATVTRGDELFTVTRNESTYIPIGERHRLENRGKIPLQIIEVQVGEYLEEDDIERFDDVYQRHQSN